MKNLKLFIRHHVIKSDRTYLFFCAISLALGLGLLLVRPKPVVGRWDVPQTIESAKGGHSSLAKSPVITPTPTPVVLPEQAQVPILMYHYVSELPPDADAVPVADSVC